MEKYRIVQLTHNAGFEKRETEWVIEQKKWFGWKEIFKIEGPKKHKRISHKSYDKAEKYLFENYTGEGICKRYDSYYTFEKYNYSTL